ARRPDRSHRRRCRSHLGRGDPALEPGRGMSRRVVVTGLGMVTPLGVGVPANWEAVRAGRSGIGPITRFASEGFPCRIAGEVRGVNLTTTTACASGAHAIGEAFEMIRSGRQDVVVTGGAEAAITPTAVAGFGVMRALARWDGPPEGASRPFDARRSGFVLGEGAGVLVLEAEEIARRRGAPVRAEVLGYGAS